VQHLRRPVAEPIGDEQLGRELDGLKLLADAGQHGGLQARGRPVRGGARAAEHREQLPAADPARLQPAHDADERLHQPQGGVDVAAGEHGVQAVRLYAGVDQQRDGRVAPGGGVGVHRIQHVQELDDRDAEGGGQADDPVQQRQLREPGLPAVEHVGAAVAEAVHDGGQHGLRGAQRGGDPAAEVGVAARQDVTGAGQLP
jgi:hypothetical protein